MPFVPAPHCALVELRMTLDSQQVENTLWVQFDTAPTIAQLTTLNNDMLAWWLASYGPLVSDQLELREIVVTDMSSATGPQVALPAPAGSVGGLTTAPAPNNVSLTVSFRTAARGRSFRGRNYLVGIVENSFSGNTYSPSFLSAVAAAYEELLPTGSALSDGLWSVVSRFSGVDGAGKPVPRTTAVVTNVLSVTIVDAIVDSQRRRLPGRGN